jgi:thioester reductase-like protein
VDVDEDVPDSPGEPADEVLVLSARSAASLVALKAKFRSWLADRPDGEWPSISFTAAVGRAHLPHRVAIAASSPGEAVTALDAGAGHSGLLESGSAPRLAMIFAGQGAFNSRDIRRLYDEREVFRRTIDACEPLAGAATPFSLRDTIFADATDTRTDLARDAALFAIEVALYRLWEDWGARPHAVIGHGLGEYAAAHVAGLLSLEDAFRLLRARATLLEPFASRTASTLVFASAIDVSRLLGTRPDVSIAAINGPAMVVVSGERLAIDRACATFAAAGIRVSPLTESTAAHTGLVDEGLDAFEAAIRGLASGEAQLRLVSGLTGTALSISQRCDTAYWRRQMREPVRFEAGVHALATDWKCDTFVEIGPSGAFVGLARQSLSTSREVAWIPSLTAQRTGARDLQEALGRLYVRGVPVDWQRVHAGPGRRRLRLPMYPFERRRYWLAEVSSSRDASIAATGVDAIASPLPAAPPARPKEDGVLMRVMSMTPADRRLDLLRQLLKSRVATLLGFESPAALDDRRPLNEIGLNSLMALELKSELDRELGTVIPVAALFEHVTVEALARFLGRTYFDAADAEDLDQPLRSLRDEVALPEDIRVEGPSASAADARSVLLTGATGYLGAYLLRSLLTHTTATVHCLVRGQSPAAARERLLARQREIAEWDDALSARITVVPGDLAEPRFGLDAAAYALMGDTIEVVYHTAATVNFILPYQALKRSIVGGTTEVLRFCAAGRPKPLHYVGTVAVLLSPGFQAADRLPEHEDLGDGSGLPMGYAQAKWVAEQLVLTARARGLSTTVYRPGFIGGHSRTGDCKLDDLIPRLAQGCVELGYAPDFGGNVMDFSPVDYVSDAVVRLSRRSGAAGGIFHLTHPSPTPWERFVEKMRERGYRLETLPYQDWLTRLQGLSEASALRGLVPFFEGVPTTLLRIPPAECARTRQALNGAAPSCPDQTELLDRYLEYFWRIGWIPLPAGRV